MSGAPAVGVVLQQATRLLSEHPPLADEARLTAELWLAHLLGQNRTWLHTHPDAEIDPQTYAQYENGLAQLRQGYPLPYLLGSREFYGRAFIVTPAVLIPRPETEHLIEAALAQRPTPIRIADVGTGSGCIAITLGLAWPIAEVWAGDISTAALAVAQNNASRLGAKNVHLMVSDGLSNLPGRFDLICSNPPYIESHDLADLAVSKYEPQLALDGGEDGLTVIRALLNSAPAKLNPGGGLLIEIGSNQAAVVLALAQAAFPTAAVDVLPDLAGHDRVLRITYN